MSYDEHVKNTELPAVTPTNVICSRSYKLQPFLEGNIPRRPAQNIGNLSVQEELQILHAGRAAKVLSAGRAGSHRRKAKSPINRYLSTLLSLESTI